MPGLAAPIRSAWKAFSGRSASAGKDVASRSSKRARALEKSSSKPLRQTWLQPKPKGFIPDLTDVDDLMWIENELKKANLSAEKRAALEGLDKKALAGDLK